MSNVRSELVDALRQLADQYPHWRIGQVVANAAAWAGGDRPGTVWDVTDEEMLRAVRQHLANKPQTPASANSVRRTA
jgi:hypothetical protein